MYVQCVRTRILGVQKPFDLCISRTHYCGEVRAENVGEKVVIAGWVQSTRLDKFLLLRDRTGLVQVFVPPGQTFSELLTIDKESVISLTGRVRRRPEGQENQEMSSGQVID